MWYIWYIDGHTVHHHIVVTILSLPSHIDDDDDDDGVVLVLDDNRAKRVAEERSAAAAAAGGIGDDIKHGAGKKPKLKKHVDYSDKIDNVFATIGSQKNMFAEFGEMMKTIVATPAAATSAPTVTPDAFTAVSNKIAMLQAEKKRALELGDSVANISSKIAKLQDDRDKL